MTTEQLAALREELRTQDSACTAHPLYCVYDHHLTGRRKSTAPKDNWRFITACLTKKAAERYIAEHSHRVDLGGDRQGLVRHRCRPQQRSDPAGFHGVAPTL